MKCPHCERTWDPADLGSTVLIPENVLREHISRFCPGSPAHARPAAAPRKAVRPLAR